MSGKMKAIEETAEKVLRQALAHAVLRDGYSGATQDGMDAAIAPLEAHTRATLGMLNECLSQASMAGANAVHQALHQMPGVDHEMLDESAAYAPESGRIPADDPVKP